MEKCNRNHFTFKIWVQCLIYGVVSIVSVGMARPVVNSNDFNEHLPCFLSYQQLIGEESLRTRKSPKNKC